MARYFTRSRTSEKRFLESNGFSMVDKKVRTLAEARRECARLDRLLFDGWAKSMFFGA